MGLGLHGGGMGAAQFFAKLGSRVTVTDLKTKRELAASLATLRRSKGIVYHLGGHRAADFRTADYVVKNPGVPENSRFLKVAARARVPVISDVEVFFAACPAPIIGITGTKGKTTTATLIGAFLKAGGKRTWVGGNIRKSVLELLSKIKKGDWVVLELSSFQLDSLGKSRLSPRIAVITNIFPDHFNRYPTMRSYTASKCGIFRYQRKSDHLFVNSADTLLVRLSRRAPARVVRFRVHQIVQHFKNSISRDIPAYHLPNVAAAIAVARHLGVGERAIRTVLRNFRGVAGRMEPVRRLRGTEFINDTTATNPQAAREAILATKRRIGRAGLHVIAGGSDKGLPLADFTRSLVRNAASVVFLPGAGTVKMESGISRLRRASSPAGNRGAGALTIRHAASMREAVRIAFRAAKRGDVVLLSPGAASFGLFQNEFDRGDQFSRAVRHLR